MLLLRNIFFLTAFILLSGVQSGFAQGAKFEVNSEVACNPFTVVVNDLSGVPDSVAVNYDWGDGSPLDSTEFHTYSQPGIYTIIQTVANANPRQDTVVVEVVNQYPPEFLLFNCKGTFGSVIVQDTLYEAFEINWGDGFAEVVSANSLTSHDYGIISSFDVTVKGLINGAQTTNDSSNINCFATTKRLNMIIDIQPATINQVQVISTDAANGTISVNYSLPPDNNYLVEIRDQNQGSFTIIDTINQILNPNNIVIQNLNTEDNYYCISITSFDPCDGDMRQSNIGCSINLNTTAQNQENLIEWNTASTDFFLYSIYKDNNFLTNVNVQNQNQYLDDQVVCGITYAYQVRMTENNGFVSLSDTNFVDAISTEIPEAIDNISATVDGKNISLSWEEPVNYLAVGYIISRSEDGTNYEVLDTVTSTNYLDEELLTNSTQYYYSISYLDGCNNLSEVSIISSPVLLVKEYDNTLYWTEYQGWSNGVSEYILEKYNENGELLVSVPLGLSTSYQEDPVANPYQFILYKIVTVPLQITNEEVSSNILEVVYRSKVTFPNAFSPDGDGMNDTFNFKSRYIAAVQMKIYTRWGELIFQTNEIDKGWDGTINGRPAPLGTYIHHTELTDDMGITFVKSGEIILIR